MGMIRKTLAVTAFVAVPVGPPLISGSSKKQRRAKEAVEQQKIANALLAAATAGKPISLAEAQKLVRGNRIVHDRLR